MLRALPIALFAAFGLPHADESAAQEGREQGRIGAPVDEPERYFRPDTPAGSSLQGRALQDYVGREECPDPALSRTGREKELLVLECSGAPTLFVRPDGSVSEDVRIYVRFPDEPSESPTVEAFDLELPR